VEGDDEKLKKKPDKRERERRGGQHYRSGGYTERNLIRLSRIALTKARGGLSKDTKPKTLGH